MRRQRRDCGKPAGRVRVGELLALGRQRRWPGQVGVRPRGVLEPHLFDESAIFACAFEQAQPLLRAGERDRDAPVEVNAEMQPFGSPEVPERYVAGAPRPRVGACVAALPERGVLVERENVWVVDR